MVGRRGDIATVTELLEATRLLTLTGTGGVGKSRLALQVAAGLTARFADGVWLVELAPLADPELAPGAVLAAMAIPQQPSRSALDSVIIALRTRQLLLVLDNCEHLLESCATLAETLLERCPEVQILATSREPLRVPGEIRWRVPSLSLPPAEELAALEPVLAEVAAYEAVQLFLERARTVQPSLSLTTVNVQLVAGICIQLDGIPLALELAAARLSALGVADLATHLDQRFRLLTGGGPGTVPRQQTLEATVTWSYDLLSPQEQRLFARLSVFARGWILAAAEAVGAGGAIAPEDVLNLLSQLVDKSLVAAEPLDDGSTWYRLLETMRQYGWQRLTAIGETAAVQRRHAAFYLALSDDADHELWRPDALHWFDRLERENDNLRAALTWCLAEGEELDREDASPPLDIGLGMAGNLRWFWLHHDHYREELAWLDRALPRAGAAPPQVRARAVWTAGLLAGFMNDLTRSRTLAAESVALFRELGEGGELSVALTNLGWALWRSGEEQQAVTALDESLALARKVGERFPIALALMHDVIRIANTAAIERPEERARAWTAGTEALYLYRAMGSRWTGSAIDKHFAEQRVRTGEVAVGGCLRNERWMITSVDVRSGARSVNSHQLYRSLRPVREAGAQE
jgi:predicted ATPase